MLVYRFLKFDKEKTEFFAFGPQNASVMMSAICNIVLFPDPQAILELKIIIVRSELWSQLVHIEIKVLILDQ